MASQYDPSDFVDSDFEATRQSPFSASTTTASAAGEGTRAMSREEVDAKVSEAQLKLVELKRAQEQLERERASLEETRRRQMEFKNGREEMVHSLTRGLTLLQESEIAARRETEQMAKSIAALQDALQKVQALNEQAWTKESYSTELTRALAVVENARMEWNSARLKFAVLSGQTASKEVGPENSPLASLMATQSFSELCRMGLALTWPIALAVLLVFLAVVLKH